MRCAQWACPADCSRSGRARRWKGTDNIRVEMHGKDRGIDARRPFAAGWLHPDRLRASSVRAMARRISVSPRRSPRAVVGVRHRRTRPGAVESNAGMVCKGKRPLFTNQSSKVELQRQDHRSLQALPLRFHRHKGFGACPLPCISTRMLSVPLILRTNLLMTPGSSARWRESTAPLRTTTAVRDGFCAWITS